MFNFSGIASGLKYTHTFHGMCEMIKFISEEKCQKAHLWFVCIVKDAGEWCHANLSKHMNDTAWGIIKHVMWFHLQMPVYISLFHNTYVLSTVLSLHHLTFAGKQDSSAANAVNQHMLPHTYLPCHLVEIAELFSISAFTVNSCT